MNRNFNLLLGGQFVSQTGDKFHMLAVALLVLETTGSPARMGLVLFCSVFPGMVLGVVSGAFLDRFDRKAIIVGADAVRGLAVLALCALYARGALSFPALLTVQFVVSACTAFFDPAIPAIIPQLVEPEDLTRANSRTQLAAGIAMVAGPALGGVTVAWAGYLAVFALNAASYLLSALMEIFIRLPPRRSPAPGNTGIGGDIVDGWRYVCRRRPLIVILGMVCVIHLFVGCIEAVIPVLSLHLKGESARNIGFIQAFFGIGTVAAALFISVKGIDGREIAFLFGGVLLVGVLLLAVGGLRLAGLGMVGPFLLLFSAIGGGIIFAGVSFRSILQKGVAERMTGRVFGLVSCVGNVSIPLATLVAGILMESVSPAAIAAVSGLLLLPVSVFSCRGYLRITGGKLLSLHTGRYGPRDRNPSSLPE